MYELNFDHRIKRLNYERTVCKFTKNIAMANISLEVANGQNRPNEGKKTLGFYEYFGNLPVPIGRGGADFLCY